MRTTTRASFSHNSLPVLQLPKTASKIASVRSQISATDQGYQIDAMGTNRPAAAIWSGDCETECVPLVPLGGVPTTVVKGETGITGRERTRWEPSKSMACRNG